MRLIGWTRRGSTSKWSGGRHTSGGGGDFWPVRQLTDAVLSVSAAKVASRGEGLMRMAMSTSLVALHV